MARVFMDAPEPLKGWWENAVAALKNLYLSLEERYYRMAEYLEAHHIPFAKVFLEPIEKQGIPSFPIFALIVLALAGVGIYAAFGASFSASTSVKVTVLSEEGKVNGAFVELFGKDLNRTGTTENGAVEFAKLPKGARVTVRVTKGGYRTAEQFLVLGQKKSVSFSLQSNAVSVTVLVQDFQERPLPQARIDYVYLSYSGRRETKSAEADLEGKALVETELGATVDATVSLEGYESKTLSFTADEGLRKKVFLRLIPQPQNTTPPSQNTEYSTLTVNTQDEHNDALEAHVQVRDADTNELLAEADTQFGTTVFSALKVGDTVKVVAEAEAYERAIATVTLTRTKTLTLKLKKLVGGTRSVIKVQDSKGKPLPAYVAILEIGEGNNNFTIVKEASEQAELSAILAPARAYYAVAYKAGFLPAKTLHFAAGESKTITLFNVLANNSANLTLSAKDEDGLNITQAVALAFYDKDGEWVPPFNVKILRGTTTFQGLLRERYFVQASYNTLKGNVSVDLSSGSASTDIVLYYPRGTLRFFASDFDNNTLTNFQAFVYFQGFRNNSLHARCTASGATSCDVEVRADKVLNLSVLAPLYRPWFKTLDRNTVKVNNVTEQQARLVHLNDSSIVKIAFTSLEDSEGNAVTNVVADRYYLARFSVYFAEATNPGGVYVRVSSPSYQEIAYIVNTTQEPSFHLNGSTVLRGDGNFSNTNLSSSICMSDYAGGENYALAWADYQYDFIGVRETAYWIRIKPSVANASNFSVNYRAYAVAGNKYYRTPLDAALGNSFEVAGRPWCAAQTLAKVFPLSSCGGFNQACCTTRAAPDFACDNGYQCLAGACVFPTSCGSSTLYCSDNNVCCRQGNSKSCQAADACTTPAQCVPECDPEEQYCDSADPQSGGICRTVACGQLGQTCCGGTSCDEGFLCTQGTCQSCGLYGQVCCAYTAQNPESACTQGLQCVGNQCVSSTFCGSQENACTGGTVCCKDPEDLGQCVPNNECNAPVACSPACTEEQYCDASDLNRPACKTCDEEHCPLGKPGGLCLPSAANPCPVGYICLPNSNSSLGTCTPCGQENQACCTNNACNPGPGLSCSTTQNKCVFCGGNGEACCSAVGVNASDCETGLVCRSTAQGEKCGPPDLCGGQVCNDQNPFCCVDQARNTSTCVADQSACQGQIESCEPPCADLQVCLVPSNGIPYCAECFELAQNSAFKPYMSLVCPNYCHEELPGYDCPAQGSQERYCNQISSIGGQCANCGGEGQACCPNAQGIATTCKGDALFCAPDGMCAERIACNNDICTGSEKCCATRDSPTAICAAEDQCIGPPIECANNCNDNPNSFCKVTGITAQCQACASEPADSPLFQLFCSGYCDASKNTCDPITEICDLQANRCLSISGECNVTGNGNAFCNATYGSNYSCMRSGSPPKFVCSECGTDQRCQQLYNSSYFCSEQEVNGFTRGVCQVLPECRNDQECKDKYQNSTFICRLFTCQPPDAQCVRDAQCANTSMKCENYACVPKTCVDDAGICGADFKCDNVTAACIPKTCVDTGICPEGLVCNNATETCEPPDCGDFGEECCAGTDSCKDWMQCVAGTCTYPTACGSSSALCQDNQVCCQQPGNSKFCADNATTCGPGNQIVECTPSCDPNSQYCDASGASGGICRPAICGLEGQFCCAGAACGSNLRCSDDTTTCVDCGTFGQTCCPYQSSNPQAACISGLQCQQNGTGPGSCGSPTFCGSQQNECTGGTVCCKDPEDIGQCVLNSQCTSPAKCSPACGASQYCDATNLNNPLCRLCDSQHCEMGGVGELCNPIEAQPCENANTVCIVSSATAPFGTCQACGAEDQACCSAGACTGGEGLVCDYSDSRFGSAGGCRVGNTLCRNGNCITISFAQLSSCKSPDITNTTGCSTRTGDSGFDARSMEFCDSEQCDDRELQIKYVLQPYRSTFPLTFQLVFQNNSDHLRFTKAVGSGGGLQTFSGTATNSLTLTISDAGWLSGTIYAKPWKQARNVQFQAVLKNATHSTNFSAYVDVVNGTPPRNPSILGMLFSCNYLKLDAFQGGRGPYMASTCDRVVFQVDALFPADAVKANFSGLNTPFCSSTFIKFYKDGDLRQDASSCFDWTSTTGGTALRYNPTKTGCILNHTGFVNPRSANVTMALRCSGVEPILKNVSLEILNVSMAQTVPAIDVSRIGYKDSYLGVTPHPYSYYYYDSEFYSPLRTVYVVDNRQLRDANENVSVGEYSASGGTYSFTGTLLHRGVSGTGDRASIFAWNSQEEPEISIYFSPTRVQDPATKLISTLRASNNGVSKTSISKKVQQKAAASVSLMLILCDAFNLNSCTRASEKVYLKDVLDEFKATAMQAAHKTAFRRSFTNTVYCTLPLNESGGGGGGYAASAGPGPSYYLNDPAYCRPTLDDWRNLTIEPQTQQLECTFCDASPEPLYNPNGLPVTAPQKDPCDSDCVQAPECSAVSSSGYCIFLSPPGDGDRNTAKLKVNCNGPLEELDENGTHVRWYVQCSAADPKFSSYSTEFDVSSSSYQPPEYLDYTCNSADGCIVPCEGKDLAEDHDYCGDPAACSACAPNGYSTIELPPTYTYEWLNTSPLYETTVPGHAGDPGSPYKYFANDARLQNGFEFSMVLQASAHQLYTLLPEVVSASAPDYWTTDTKQLLDNNPACQVRQGLFLLTTRTKDGTQFTYDESSGEVFNIRTLNVQTNYPKYASSAYTPEYCGSVLACNLFDPKNVHTLNATATYYYTEAFCIESDYYGNCIEYGYRTVSVPSNVFKIPTSWYPSSSYPKSCFTYEFPLVPEEWRDRPSYNWTGMYPNPLKKEDRNYIQIAPYNPIPGTPSFDLRLALNDFIFRYSKRDKWGCFDGCNYRYRYDYFGPYNLAAYPSVFGSKRQENCKSVDRPGYCGVVVIDDGQNVDLRTV